MDATPGGLPLPLLCALEAARRRYQGFPNVLGVAAGFKFCGGRRVARAAVQFFVGRKSERPARRLPRFVLGRDRRGRILRRMRIPTDVIPTRPLRFACGAGSRLYAQGERGSLTLLFRDRSLPGAAGEGRGSFYLLTCAHVVGDLERSPPLSSEIRLAQRPAARPFARVLKNSRAEKGVVEHDVALARVVPQALPVRELEIEGGGHLSGWLDPEDLELGMELEMSAASGRSRGALQSLAGEFLVRLDGHLYRVRNLFGLSAPAREGDSGGLVHARGRAAGMVVARSPGGFAWWQPLRPALDHLNRSSPRTGVEPFGKDQGRGRRQ